MDFTVEFYETVSGACPMREFLEDLKISDPDDFAIVVAGLAKLRNSSVPPRTTIQGTRRRAF
jgi:hypothetical protein